jgi:23S rRNA (cytidine1920-2'-O)/16S rRNA (cytidine1409-2'-O)-methyltransferase
VKDRADKILVDRKIITSRSQAKSLIEKGDVYVNGVQIKKASEMIAMSDTVEVRAPLFVGRGAFKLEKALEEFKLDVKEKVFLDVGASTGGFTEILLQFGATKVYAIDVGHGQLAKKLQLDSRVINLEGTNIRELESLPELADGAVMDLSFISVTKVLINVKKMLKLGADLIVLVKPQFEVGADRLPKDGVVKDENMQKEVLAQVVDFAQINGWTWQGTIVSPITGKSGNVEFLIHLKG